MPKIIPAETIIEPTKKPGLAVVYNVQYLRLLAAALVLFGHTQHEAGDNRIERAGQLAIMNHIDWRSGVDVFFIISGFIMILISWPSRADICYPAHFMIERICRIVPNYWIFTTLMLGVVLIIPSSINHDKVSPIIVFTSYLFIPWPNQFGKINPLLDLGWTLNYEMFFYVIYAISLRFGGIKGPALAIMLIGVFVIAGLAVSPTFFILWCWTRPIMLEFAGGMMLGLAFMRGVRLPRWAFTVGASVATPLLLVLPVQYPYLDRLVTGGLPALLLVGSAALSGDVLGEQAFLRKILLTGGASSYILYLSHPFSINIVAHVFTVVGCHDPWLYLACATTFAMMMAVVCYLTLERPIQQFLRRWLAARHA